MSSQVDEKAGSLIRNPETFSLDAVIADPSQVATLSPEIAQSLLISLATIHPILLQRALTASREESEEDLLTIPQVAKRLKVSDYRAYELARQGFLKSVRLGKSVRVKQSALMEYLAGQES